MNLSRYVGIPWKDKGRTLDGADCYGLVVCVYKEVLSIDLPALSRMYSTASDRKTISALIRHKKIDWTPVASNLVQPLDLVLMREGGLPTHIGMVARPGTVLHMRPRQDSVIESYESGLLAPRVVGFYRYSPV
jgi:cell wall-associated NlpC family hydrolase